MDQLDTLLLRWLIEHAGVKTTGPAGETLRAVRRLRGQTAARERKADKFFEEIAG